MPYGKGAAEDWRRRSQRASVCQTDSLTAGEAASAPLLRQLTNVQRLKLAGGGDLAAESGRRLDGVRTASGTLDKDSGPSAASEAESRAQRSLETAKTWSRFGGTSTSNGKLLYSVASLDSVSTIAGTALLGGSSTGSLFTALAEGDEESTASASEDLGELPEGMPQHKVVSMILNNNLTHQAAIDILEKIKDPMAGNQLTDSYFESANMYGEIGDGLLGIRSRLKRIEASLEIDSLDLDAERAQEARRQQEEERRQELEQQIFALEMRVEADMEMLDRLDYSGQAWGRQKLGRTLGGIVFQLDRYNWSQLCRLLKRWVQCDTANHHLVKDLLQEIAEQESEALHLMSMSRLKVTEALSGRVVSATRLLMGFHDRILEEMRSVSAKRKELREDQDSTASRRPSSASSGGLSSVRIFREQMADTSERHMKHMEMNRAMQDFMANRASIFAAPPQLAGGEGHPATSRNRLSTRPSVLAGLRQSVRRSTAFKRNSSCRTVVEEPPSRSSMVMQNRFAVMCSSSVSAGETKAHFIETAAKAAETMQEQLIDLVTRRAAEVARVKDLRQRRQHLWNRLNSVTIRHEIVPQAASMAPVQPKNPWQQRLRQVGLLGTAFLDRKEDRSASPSPSLRRNEMGAAQMQDARELQRRLKIIQNMLSRFDAEKDSIEAEVSSFYGEGAWVTSRDGVDFKLNPREAILHKVEQSLDFRMERNCGDEEKSHLADLYQVAGVLVMKIRNTPDKERAALDTRIDQLVWRLQAWHRGAEDGDGQSPKVGATASDSASPIQHARSGVHDLSPRSGGTAPDSSERSTASLAQHSSEAGRSPPVAARAFCPRGADEVDPLTAELAEQEAFLERYQELQKWREKVARLKGECDGLARQVLNGRAMRSGSPKRPAWRPGVPLELVGSPRSPTKGFPPMLRTTSKRSRTKGSEASSRKLGGEVREPAEAEEASVQLELAQAEEENRWLHGERDRMRRESNLLEVSIGANMEAEELDFSFFRNGMPASVKAGSVRGRMRSTRRLAIVVDVWDKKMQEQRCRSSWPRSRTRGRSSPWRLRMAMPKGESAWPTSWRSPSPAWAT
ncbi:unnamed protein product [Prorocentrum cordatum]|uniref:Uncharacterized protein n=1 Tax=Prorocentrum cordatum TaxID=2364126 RepID=A0ABN9XSB8_9DINO|nr:unnamed protein product [Polarella glacialis]